MIIGKNLDEFKKYNFLYIKNILEGIENFKHICFKGNYESYNLFIKSLIRDNKNGFFDFYFSNLEKNEKEVFYTSNNYVNIIKRFKFNKDKLYFNIDDVDEEIVDFITEISYKGILFSTFYFKNPSMTLWTNYNNQFILFFESDEFILEHKKLAKNLSLEILFEKY